MGDTLDDDPILRLPEVMRQSGLRKTAIYKAMGEGAFPRARRLVGGAVGWPQSAITAWKVGRPKVDYRKATAS